MERKLGESALLVPGIERWWVFGKCVELCDDGRRILTSLLRAGYPIDRRWLRIAYAMPLSWKPADTLSIVFPHVLLGTIVDDRRYIAVPVVDRAAGWAVWVIVDPDPRTRLREYEIYT